MRQSLLIFAAAVSYGATFSASYANECSGNASFDCTNASAPSDKIICGSVRLRNVDCVLGVVYKNARSLVNDDEKKEITASQRMWVKGRNDGCKASPNIEACYEATITDRIGQLSAIIAKHQHPSSTQCTPRQPTSRIFSDASMTRPAIDQGGYIGTSWTLDNVKQIAAASGAALQGFLISPRGGSDGKLVFVPAADWDCGTAGEQTAQVPVQPPPPPPVQAAPPPVAAPPSAFGNNDLDRIARTASENETRFQRDYKGKAIAIWGTFDSLQDAFWGNKQLAVNVGDTQVHCYGRASLAQKAIDWNAGDRLLIQGKIRDTILGILQIDECDADKR